MRTPILRVLAFVLSCLSLTPVRALEEDRPPIVYLALDVSVSVNGAAEGLWQGVSAALADPYVRRIIEHCAYEVRGMFWSGYDRPNPYHYPLWSHSNGKSFDDWAAEFLSTFRTFPKADLTAPSPVLRYVAEMASEEDEYVHVVIIVADTSQPDVGDPAALRTIMDNGGIVNLVGDVYSDLDHHFDRFRAKYVTPNNGESLRTRDPLRYVEFFQTVLEKHECALRGM